MSKPTTAEETRQMIAGCKAGKRKAQHQLFKLYYGRAMATCMRYAKSEEEAEDMLNEGFIKIFANIGMYEEEGSFDAWVKKVMVNAAIDYQRKYKTLVVSANYEDVPEIELHNTTENTAIAKMSAEELTALIQRLPATTRAVFNLYVFEDYSHAEIAKMLDMKEGTSHWHLNHARTKLKEMINAIQR